MNIILAITSICVCFTGVVIAEKLGKKEGLFAWVAVATVIANIIVCKTITIGGACFTLGNVMFASNFLATDILNEKYGSVESKRAVIFGLASAVVYIIATQIALLFIPADSDFANDTMVTLFTLSLRTSLASVTCYFLSNLADVYLFDVIKKKIPDKLWLRNNVATITTNCVENFLFAILAFSGLMDIKSMLEIAITTSIAETIIGISDTPFIYWATRWWQKK